MGRTGISLFLRAGQIELGRHTPQQPAVGDHYSILGIHVPADAVRAEGAFQFREEPSETPRHG